MKKIIAIDLGGTNLRVALTKNNKIEKYIKKNTPKEKNSLLKELEDSISKFISKDVIGIGMGSPGPLKNGVILNPPNIPLKNFDIKTYLEKKFKKRTVIENDAHCVAIAEAELGHKKNNFIVLTLGTGIGGGIIINKKLYLGKDFAGELGHIIIDKGKYLETLWKETKKEIVDEFGKEILIKDLLKMESAESKKILDKIFCYLSQGIASLVNIFDPEIVVLSGGIKETGKEFLKKIEKETNKHVIFPRKTKIAWTKLKHPGIIGASLLIK